MRQVSSDDAAQLKALEKEIRKEEAVLAELRRKSEALASKAAALEAQIEGAGGEKLRKQKALVAKQQEVGGWAGGWRAGGGGGEGKGLLRHWQGPERELRDGGLGASPAFAQQTPYATDGNGTQKDRSPPPCAHAAPHSAGDCQL